MASKKRGGRRPGAGRPPALGQGDRWAVGALIFQRLWEQAHRDLDRAIHEAHGDDDLLQLWTELAKLQKQPDERSKLEPDELDSVPIKGIPNLGGN